MCSALGLVLRELVSLAGGGKVNHIRSEPSICRRGPDATCEYNQPIRRAYCSIQLSPPLVHHIRIIKVIYFSCQKPLFNLPEASVSPLQQQNKLSIFCVIKALSMLLHSQTC